jgi:hypothetical protein
MLSNGRPKLTGERLGPAKSVPFAMRQYGEVRRPNPARRIVAAAGIVAVFAIMATGAVLIATRKQAPPAAEPSVATAAQPSVAASVAAPVATSTVSPIAPPAGRSQSDDFTWLVSAMSACDKAALEQPGNLHFLVIPLLADPKDMPDWQLIASGVIGNAVSLPSDDALGGLRKGTLKIYPDQYVFNIQDAATRAVYRWNPAVGVTSLSSSEGDMIQSFRAQILPQNKADSGDWGLPYQRQKGRCHWVAAIIRN